jgi:DNA mismatch repair protein MutL
VINKIAAGEVIERPASVVKELLENSVDSGADQIEIIVEKGGTEAITIIDNGCGIPHDQLELAVTSHATSKISDADDLFRVGTFGFRGEALASIASVSQCVIRSRSADQETGFELIINGGNTESLAPCSQPFGTSISIRELFYNTPVRRKFMRTVQTEMGHITEAFTRVALAYPNLGLKLTHNTRTLHHLHASENWQDRISAFFGPEIADKLIPIESEHNDIKLSGFVVDPSVSRANNRMQYLFLNGRYIRDRSLQHALTESYRGLLMTGRYPVVFLKLDIPYDQVDVNVHPAKLEVRFQDGGKIYSQLLGTIRNRFLSTDLTAKAQLQKPSGNEPSESSVNPKSFALNAPPNESQSRMDFRPTAPVRDFTSAPVGQGPGSMSAGSHSVPAFKPFPGAMPIRQPINPNDPFAPTSSETRSAEQVALEQVAFPTTPASMPRQTALQVHNTYLITETEEGMVVIDQHALHERIIYEQLREKVLADKVESQKLLVPEPVTLPPSDAAAVLDQKDTLKKLGIEVEEFGGDTVLVSAYPAMLAKQNPAEMLRGIVESLTTEGSEPDRRDLIDELLHMMSCKAAVKAGDELTPEEISDLLNYRELCQDAHHCPHGRPTALVFSREDLDKKFKRI